MVRVAPLQSSVTLPRASLVQGRPAGPVYTPWRSQLDLEVPHQLLQLSCKVCQFITGQGCLVGAVGGLV